MDQHEYVINVYSYYAENHYEPGNPEDGLWEECHYPVPKCKGGTLTILLLKEHHAVQGVLQSEEYSCPCIYGWEKKYLPKKYLHLWKKWMAVKAQSGINSALSIPIEIRQENGRKGNALQPIESKRKGGRSCQAKRTREEKKRLAKYMHDITPQEKQKAVEKAKQTNLKNNPNYYKDMAKKARDSETYEIKAARAKSIPKESTDKGRALTNSRKYKCLVTDHVSTAGPLTRYQKARGIDPSLRERVV
jgi:hypothetical protein